MPISLAHAASRVSRIMARYTDIRIDLADAPLIHFTNEFATGDIPTVDSDFQSCRWRRDNGFRILIPLGGRRPQRAAMESPDPWPLKILWQVGCQ